MASSIELYDTTLRDGTQMEGISLSVEDKLKIARKLDELGVHYIEGGWPGSNPKNAGFFPRARGLGLRNPRLPAFGSTRRAGSSAESDLNLRALVDAGTPVVTIVGKAHDRHVTRILETTTEENLAMIADSVRYLKSQGLLVFFDAEHFFDGFASDRGYALQCLKTAAGAGADCVVLCDTNGGTITSTVAEVVRAVVAEAGCAGGIHTHNTPPRPPARANPTWARPPSRTRRGCTSPPSSRKTGHTSTSTRFWWGTTPASWSRSWRDGATSWRRCRSRGLISPWKATRRGGCWSR